MSNQVSPEKKIKYFVTGWVQVAVSATIEAKNLLDLKEILESDGNMSFEEGNWESHIESLKVEERNGKPFVHFIEGVRI
jgi:hypothetical protein